MRGSDPDAALYYLARMLYAGEDIRFIARRIMTLRIGRCRPMQIPMALAVAVSCRPGGGTARYAGGKDRVSPGGFLCGVCAQE